MIYDELLLEWGRKREEIIELLQNNIFYKEIVAKIFSEIMEFDGLRKKLEVYKCKAIHGHNDEALSEIETSSSNIALKAAGKRYDIVCYVREALKLEEDKCYHLFKLIGDLEGFVFELGVQKGARGNKE